MPDRWFDVGTLKRAPWSLVLLTLTLPIFAATWASAAVPAFALPGVLFAGWMLVALAVIDARTFVLPDYLTLPLMLAGVVHAAWTSMAPSLDGWNYLAAAVDSIIAAAIGFAFMALTARLFRLLRNIEGLGLGDAKLLGAAGAWVGLAGLPSVVLLAASCALVMVLVARRLRGKSSSRWEEPIQFGPYLAAGFWIVLLHGPLSFG